MNISYNYRPSYLITIGIGFIIIFSLVLISTVLFIINDILSNVATKDQIFIIGILTGEPIIIGYGVYNIIKGTVLYEIQFSEINFKSYKNSRLEIDLPVERIESVNIFHGNYFNTLLFDRLIYKEIEIALKENEKVHLYIRGKKWISKFLKFIKLLREYCSEKYIQFDESSNGSEKHVSNYIKAFIVFGPFVILIIVILFILIS